MPIEMPAAAGPSARFLGLDFSLLSMDEVLREIRRLSGSDRFSYIVTPNVDHIVTLNPKTPNERSRAFIAAYDAAVLRICDSRILQKIGHMFGIRLPVVPGSDLTVRLFKGFFLPTDRIAIIGGAENVLARLNEQFPGPLYLQHRPPMGVLANPEAQQDIVRFVATEAPDMVLFAIGSPQSEIIAHRCAAQAVGGVGLCVGASIDFLLGDRKRAPLWMQRLSLEWLFRLASEPARLWRRYLVDGPRIFAIALKHRRNAD